MTLEQWNRVIGVNLTGLFLNTRDTEALLIFDDYPIDNQKFPFRNLSDKSARS
jgi:NAD(P)-dependent dehydrogenase (short-subunit alcohol dehydrogenase family)